MIRVSLMVMLGSMLVGCGGVSRSYEVNIRNESAQPVTVWLTKSAPPYEPQWKPPEQWAIERPGSEENLSGVILPPGQVASTGKVNGRFSSDTDAILRLYLGEYTVTGLLAISRGSPNRIDVVLKPGVNDLVVRSRAGRTVVEPISNPQTTNLR